jgi:hypothetical protein
MTQNFKSLLKLAFKTKTSQKKKKIKNLLKFSTKTSTTTTEDTSSYLTRYNCKNKKIDNLKSTDDTISNILPFKPIQTQILIPPPICNSKNQIEIKLSTASKLKPANIPMLVIKSYKADSTVGLKQVTIKKGSAVNALYMLINSWVYIKTVDDSEGFVPKNCFETFSAVQQNNVTENTNHTYMSIMDNNNEQVIDDMEEEVNDEMTNLSLFSVSRCFNIDSTVFSTTSRRTTKTTSKNIYFKSTVSSTRQYNLRRSVVKKSENERNRKVKIAYSRQIPAEMTLTMLENKCKVKTMKTDLKLKTVGKKRSLSSNSSSVETYDLLMKCTSKKSDSKFNLYQVLFDYVADFKDDISVKKGDLVFSVNEEINKDWIFVRPYKGTTQYECDGGFIPRDYLIPL